MPAVALLLACGGGDLVLPADGTPAKIEVVEGNNQSGRVGVALARPVVGRVTDAQGQPVEQVQVVFTFTADGTGATVAPATATTDADGASASRSCSVGGSGRPPRRSTSSGRMGLSPP